MVNINIPLPASCASCPLSVRHFGKLYCPPLDGRVGNEGKDSRCPLVDACDQFAEVSKKDVIYRQDAIDALDDIESEVSDGFGFQYEKWRKHFVDLPSVQPEIIRCKDCKHWDGADTCDVIDAPVWDNDFCSMAERRSDE